MSYYYSPFQRKAQEFFGEYIPYEEIFMEAIEPDADYIFYDPRGPGVDLDSPDLKKTLVMEGLRRLTATPYGRAALIGSIALAYTPLLQPGPPAKESYTFLNLGGGLIV